MTGILISLTVVLLAIAARVILRRPFWSIEKMALASVACVAAFWGYLDLRGRSVKLHSPKQVTPAQIKMSPRRKNSLVRSKIVNHFGLRIDFQRNAGLVAGFEKLVSSWSDSELIT